MIDNLILTQEEIKETRQAIQGELPTRKVLVGFPGWFEEEGGYISLGVPYHQGGNLEVKDLVGRAFEGGTLSRQTLIDLWATPFALRPTEQGGFEKYIPPFCRILAEKKGREKTELMVFPVIGIGMLPVVGNQREKEKVGSAFGRNGIDFGGDYDVINPLRKGQKFLQSENIWYAQRSKPDFDMLPVSGEGQAILVHPGVYRGDPLEDTETGDHYWRDSPTNGILGFRTEELQGNQGRVLTLCCICRGEKYKEKPEETFLIGMGVNGPQSLACLSCLPEYFAGIQRAAQKLKSQPGREE